MKDLIEMPNVRIPLAKPVFNIEMENAAVNALRNERFVSGESVQKFEEEFAKYCGVDYAVTTSSGTVALHIALMASGLIQGGRVITSPASFVASSNAILHAGGVPVFSDINLETYTLDPDLLLKVATSVTRAVIPVHLYGYPADMDSINAIAEKLGFIVIEDACQAHGALYNGSRVGSIGDVGCFSFYSSKNMTVGGDGGMITTNDKKIAEKAAKLRDCGRKSQYVHDIVGYTARLNTVNAAIGRVQLKHLDIWNAKRIQAAENYSRLLSDVEEIALPPIGGDSRIRPVFHCFVIRAEQRNKLKTWLDSNGISCGIHYALPIHLQPVYKKMYGYKKDSYHNSEELCRTCLSLPMYPSISFSEQLFVSDKIHDFFEKKEE